jgi:nucleoside-diphosphate-sugar epimerase
LIAVTGANGFLGSYVVCTLLQKGARVKALKRQSSSLDEFETIFHYFFRHCSDQEKLQFRQSLSWHHAHILDTAALMDAFKDTTTVYQCAAIVSFLQKDAPKMLETNVKGTANVVNCALICGVKILCHVSSIAAIGRGNSGEHITEDTKWVNSKNNSNYAISKYKSELEVWRGKEEGLEVVVVNPGVILGVGDWSKGSCRLFSLVWGGMPFYTLGENGYVDARDVALAMVTLVDKKITGERFILVAENIQMKWYLETVSAKLGKKPPSIHAGFLLSRMAVWVDGIRSFITRKAPVITRETARASQNVFHYSSSKINLRASFHFITIQQTISDICNEFLKHQKKLS